MSPTKLLLLMLLQCYGAEDDKLLGIPGEVIISLSHHHV